MAGNSWQQPVAGEPSWGTFHTHKETLVNSVNPSNTVTTTVTCASVPWGVVGISGYARVYDNGNTKYILYLMDEDDDIWATIRQYNDNTSGYGHFMVPLDENKRFYWWVSNAGVDAVDIFMRGYWL